MNVSQLFGRLSLRDRPCVVVALGTATVALLAASCTSKKQEATEKLDKEIKKCRASDGPVYQVPIMRGNDKTPVLTKGCEQEKGKVEMVDEFTAEIDVGPYTWEAGRDQRIGVWTIKSVSWPALDKARTLLKNEPEKNELNQAAENLREAQKQFPESGWVRLKLLDTLVKHRTKQRSSDNSGLQLGDAVEKQFQSTVEWAQSNEDRRSEVLARLKLIDYLQGFISQVEGDKSALGSQDVHLKRSADVAEEQGNKKEAEEIRKELKKRKEKRPEKRKRYNELIAEAQSNLCDRLGPLKTDGIEDGELQKRVKSAKGSINCHEIQKTDESGADKAD